MQLNRCVRTFASIQRCKSIENKECHSSVDYALVEHCSLDIIGLLDKFWKAYKPLFCNEVFSVSIPRAERFGAPPVWQTYIVCSSKGKQSRGMLYKNDYVVADLMKKYSVIYRCNRMNAQIMIFDGDSWLRVAEWRQPPFSNMAASNMRFDHFRPLDCNFSY